MLTMVVNLLLAVALALGVDVNDSWLTDGQCSSVQQMSDSSQSDEAPANGCSKAKDNPNKTLQIYNGF